MSFFTRSFNVTQLLLVGYNKKHFLPCLISSFHMPTTFNIYYSFYFFMTMIPKKTTPMQLHNNHCFLYSRAQNETGTIKWDRWSKNEVEHLFCYNHI